MKSGSPTHERARRVIETFLGRAAVQCCLRLVLVASVINVGCDAKEPPISDSNTNWLLACTSDAQCDDGTTCLCGLCTKRCTSNDECAVAGGGAQCLNTESGVAQARCTSRGHDDAQSVCAIACSLADACDDDTLQCVESLCELPSTSSDDGGIDASTDAASDANTVDANSLDAASDANANVDASTDATMTTCAPGPCSNGGECASDGMSCQCPVGITGATCDQIASVRQLVAGLRHNCALLGNNAIKCWGYNESGQLGQGDLSIRGDAPNELGANLTPVDIGETSLVRSLTAGGAHTCALLVTGSVKCWGLNVSGQLGLGDADNRGDNASELGINLSNVPLGTTRVTQLSAGDNHTCALFEDGRVACWGSNANGELGIDSALPRGDAPNQLGANLRYVNLGDDGLGTLVRATQVIASAGYSCAVSEGNAVKCWGRNINGQLGQGDTDNRGDSIGEMAALQPIALGDVSSGIRSIASMGAHVCTLLGNGSVKCWGFGGVGQLALGGTQSVGDQPNEMGANLISARLGASAQSLSCGGAHSCAVLNSNVLKCWGQNNAGQLGVGDLLNRGDDATEVDAMLPNVSLASGTATITTVAAGGFHTCVLINAQDIYCFGENQEGALGRGHTDDVGDEATELPIPPPTVAL